MYFVLQTSINNDEIGEYPQCNGVLKPYNFRGEHSIWKIDYWQPINFDIKIPVFKLYNHAKWTDCVSSATFKSGAIRLCTPQFIDVLKQFEVSSYQQYATEVGRLGELRKYSFLYFSEIHNQYIDYNKSIFYVRYVFNEERPKTVQIFRFRDEMDYNQKRQELHRLVRGRQMFIYYKLYLKEAAIKLDLFRIYGFYQGLIISERLKKALEESNLTGFRFIPIDSEGLINRGIAGME